MAQENKILYENAVSLFGEGKREEAAAALKALIERFPDEADAYETLGMIYYKMGMFDEAIAWTDKLVQLRPRYPMAHTNLSIFYMKKGMKEKAEEEKATAVVLSFSKADEKK